MMMAQKLKIAFLIACTAGSVFLWSCSGEEVHPGKTAVTTNVAASDYFRAVYFIDGPLAAALGDYQKAPYAKGSYDATALREARERQDKMLAFISEKHPGYFASFQQKVTSGDYSLVQAAVQDGLSIYKEALGVLPGSFTAAAAAAPYIVKPPYVVEPPILYIVFTQVIIDTPPPVYLGESSAAGTQTPTEYTSDNYVTTITTGFSGL